MTISKPAVYILQCANSKYHVGCTKDLNERLKEHRGGCGSHFTKVHLPFELVNTEEYEIYDAAFRRKRQIHIWSRAKKKH